MASPPLTYGGVDLLIPSSELTDFVASRFSLDDLIPFRFPAPRVNFNNISWPTPWDYGFRDRPIRLNTLWWPTGAARWAMGFFLISEQELASVRALAYAGGVYAPLTLKMDDGTNSVSPSLYMLPPIPLAPQKVFDSTQLSKWAIPTTLPTDGKQPCYVLPLVDERYFWWDRAANVTLTENTTTWATLYASLASALGITLTPETVNSAYLKPPLELTTRYESLPMALDAAAFSVGQRVIRQLDGTVTTIGSLNAKANQTTQLALNYPRMAGGLLSLDIGGTQTDLPGLCPASVSVVYPRTDTSVPSRTPWPVSVTLSSLSLTEFSGVVTHTGAKPIFASTVAAFTGGGSPTNNTELNALATQIATDWYRWRLSTSSIAYAGSCPWSLSGMEDAVEWTWGMVDKDDPPHTRIFRPPLNDLDVGMVLVSGTNGSAGPYLFDLTVESLWVTTINGLAYSPLTVQEADSSPSYSGISTLIVDQAAGLVLTQPAAGQAEVSQTAASVAAVGYVTIADQTFKGIKRFYNGSYFGQAIFQTSVIGVGDSGDGTSAQINAMRMWSSFGGSGAVLEIDIFDSSTDVYSAIALYSKPFGVYAGLRLWSHDGSGYVNPSFYVTDSTATSYAGAWANVSGLVFKAGLYISGSLSVAIGSVTGLGTGVATALAINVGSAGAIVTNGGALGTPSSGTLTNATGLPISTGISGLGAGVATALAVNVGSAGAPLVNGGVLGTPSSGTLTNATGLPISTGVSGLGTGIATALAVNVGSAGAPLVNGGVLGTPSSGTLTNCTGLPTTGLTGTLTAAQVNPPLWAMAYYTQGGF